MRFYLLFRDRGLPKTGLTPAFPVFKQVSDDEDVTPPAITEVGEGLYAFEITPAEALYWKADGGDATVDPVERCIVGVVGPADLVDDGPVPVTLTVEQPDTAPIPNAQVFILTADASTVIARQVSAVDGTVAFQLFAGTYAVWILAPNVVFANPLALTVAAPTTAVTFTGTPVPAPTVAAGTAVIQGVLRSVDGQPAKGLTVEFQLNPAPQVLGASNTVITNDPVTVLSQGDVPKTKTVTLTGTTPVVLDPDIADVVVKSPDGCTVYAEGPSADYAINLVTGELARTGSGSKIPDGGTVTVHYLARGDGRFALTVLQGVKGTLRIPHAGYSEVLEVADDATVMDVGTITLGTLG